MTAIDLEDARDEYDRCASMRNSLLGSSSQVQVNTNKLQELMKMKAHNSQVALLKVEPLKRLDEDVDGEPEHFEPLLDDHHKEIKLTITKGDGMDQTKAKEEEDD